MLDCLVVADVLDCLLVVDFGVFEVEVEVTLVVVLVVITGAEDLVFVVGDFVVDEIVLG